MTQLKIQERHIGISKTLRLPQNIVEDMEILAKIKNTTLNQIANILIRFSLDNLDLQEKEKIEKLKRGEIKYENY